MNGAIYILAELHGDAADEVREIQARFDPRLARSGTPHITLAGSSGVGPIDPGTSVAELHAALDPVGEATPPLTLEFGAPMRFMQTDIVVLPLDPYGPLRALHERIARSGLAFGHARFAFTPHCTLNFYPELTPDRARELLAVRVTTPVRIDELQIYHTLDPYQSKRLFTLPLEGSA